MEAKRRGDRKAALRGFTRSAVYALLLPCGLAAGALWTGLSPAGGEGIVMDDLRSGLSEWRKIESVLTHPRCMNCHTMTGYPTQGDERQPHPVQKLPDADDGQTAAAPCDTCHTPGWQMPPQTLAWENEPGKPAPGAAICATLTRGPDGAEPDYERIIEYAQLASVVLWAWEPGKRPDGADRSLPPISHEDFVDALKRWISAGAPCPAPETTAAGINPSPVNPSP
jgi:hypothetical protein